MYSKPHLSYAKQLELLISRGMQISDRDQHLADLRRIGYYRLSAYSYPFREWLPEERRQTETNYRDEKFVEGTTFDTVVELADFDSELRRLVFEAVEHIEVELCARVAYRAGREDPFIHRNRDSLDLERCDSKITVGAKEITRWKAWKNKFNSLRDQAKNEDFYKHFEQKYAGQMPIWVAMEFVDFGGLTRLFYLLPSGIQSAVSKEFGVTSGATFAKWIVSLNYVRNKVAHHNRLWNRTMTYSLQVPKANEVREELVHLSEKGRELSSMYDYLAVIAYMLKSIRPQLSWQLKVVRLLEQFPSSDHVSPERNMGFPQAWRQLALWS